jgi:zinc protease
MTVKFSRILFYLFFLLPFTLFAFQDKNDTSLSFQLDNGLKVFLSEKPGLPLINFVLAFDVGSKNETDQTNGLVHILEHSLLFFGSETRTPETIRREIRRHGAYFNAHTGRDLAVFEMSLPSEYAEFGLHHLKDVLFHLSLTQEALDKEKEIILEEINQSDDDPFRTAMSLIHQNIFPDHPYHRPIIGKKRMIENASVRQLQEFYENYFVCSNAALAVVGEFSLPDIENLVNHTFGLEPKSQSTSVHLEMAAPLEKTIEIEKEMDVQQDYLAIGLPAPDYNHQDQYLVDLLIEIFGRGVNPLLYHPLAERRIYPQSLRMGYSAYRYGGVITIYMGLEAGHFNIAKSLVQRYLNTTSKLNYSKTDYMGQASFSAFDFLESAKNRIQYLTETGQEKGLNTAFSLARYMLMNELEERGEYLEKIRKINSTNIRSAAGNYLSRGKEVVIGIIPQKKKRP